MTQDLLKLAEEEEKRLSQHDTILGIIKFEPDCSQSRRLLEAGLAYRHEYRKTSTSLREAHADNARLRAELDAAKQYNHLLATGHDPQCNARDGYACDCGQDNIEDSLRLQWLQDRLRVSSADCNENTVTLSMTVEFWEGVTIGENVPLRDVIDYRLREL